MKKNVFIAVLCLFSFISNASLINPLDGVDTYNMTTDPGGTAKIVFKIKYKHCSKFPGICIIWHFEEESVIGDDESFALIYVQNDKLVIEPTKVIWDENNNVPITENQLLPEITTKVIGLSGKVSIVAGNYQVIKDGTNPPKVVVDYVVE